jgi:hypothetical protein
MTSALAAEKASPPAPIDEPLLPIRGHVRFVDPVEITPLQDGIEPGGLLPVTVHASAPGCRGKLRDAIDAAIEKTLEHHGAPHAGLADGSDLGSTLSDQLFRARLVGAQGLSIRIGPLRDVATLAGALDAEDSAIMRWWLAATEDRPVAVLIDASNRDLGAYGPPTPIEALIDARARSTAAVEPPADEPPPAEDIAAAETAAPAGDEPSESHHFEDVTDPEQFPTAEPKPPPEPTASDPIALPTLDECRAWAAELDATRGPKPLSAVERLFATRYVPLSDAVSRGGGDAAIKSTLASWSDSFARSYAEAFGALRVTGRRPLMVLDAPSLAMRVARLHGARGVQLLLVDSMRFDLGLRVEHRMREMMGAHATCTEQSLLWSALPTTTATQLDLIARGPDGLAALQPASERDVPVLPTRSSATPRRMRVGSRDLVKLDLVAARLRESGPAAAGRLDALADEVAASIVQHAKTLAARTLLLVFGDHGFRFDPSDATATGPAVYGGASPDEVLVPASAWLLSALH